MIEHAEAELVLAFIFYGTYLSYSWQHSGKDEFIITRHNQFRFPINIINCYGEIGLVKGILKKDGKDF